MQGNFSGDPNIGTQQVYKGFELISKRETINATQRPAKVLTFNSGIVMQVTRAFVAIRLSKGKDEMRISIPMHIKKRKGAFRKIKYSVRKK